MLVCLQYVEHLLFDLLQLVLHLHHQTLHVGMIALRAERIDFTPHLLSNKSEFLALRTFGVHRIDKISQMLGQTLLLLVDVKLLDIEKQFLLQTRAVIVKSAEFGESFLTALPDLGRTLSLLERQLGIKVEYSFED